MTDLEEFQSQHGREWADIVRSTAFPAALSIATAEKIQSFVNLTDEKIATQAHIILADLRGHLRYEQALLGLHEQKKSVFDDGPTEDYTTNPEEEAHREAIIQGRLKQPDESSDVVLPTPEAAKPTRKPRKKNR